MTIALTNFRPVAIVMAALAIATAALAGEKPHIWVFTDMSDPRDQRAGGHPQNDPDDICSLAALLLEANRFNIEAVVFSSTNRENLADATEFVESTFVAAYANDVPYLNAAFGGYQNEIPFIRSSITRSGEPVKFDPNRDYSDLAELETVSLLVELASLEPVFVLSWGPLTESAMAVKHCLDTGNTVALGNMFIISHWTKSWIAQGTPETPFKVANCRDDAEACAYLHQIASTELLVRFIELGSVGQTGVVNGAEAYPEFEAFQGSRLGQIFVQSKFYHGKPDQSDGSSFWLLTEAFGPTLDTYSNDGSLDQATEEKNRDLFLANGHAIIEDLLLRSRAAAAARDPFPESFIMDRFIYVYQFLDGRYTIYLPYPARVVIRDQGGVVVIDDRFDYGNTPLDLSRLEPGAFDVLVSRGDYSRAFVLTKQAP